MRSLATEWGCDASTATWIVDRLETRGLAERRAHATDRRVRLVVLTPEGARIRERMLRGTYAPPPELLQLETTELLALRDATASLDRLARRGMEAPCTDRRLHPTEAPPADRGRDRGRLAAD